MDTPGMMTHELRIKPEQSIMIPLRACTFDQVCIRPYIIGAHSKESAIFDWTEKVDVSLLQDDREIFEKKPILMVSKINVLRDT
jgi:hypothetical protein